ncbi:MAG: lipopolysaccharide assembly protein LapA domain-containing protein [Burkholderiales bacterium]
MRILTWAIRIALFVLLLAFAAKNTDPVTLRFYLGLAWQAPLVAILLAFFAAGAALGLMAMLGTYLSQRRRIARLEMKHQAQESKIPLVNQPPAAEG